MKARTAAVVGRGGRLVSLSCEPPLTVRQVRTDDPDTCALCLVATAAGPLAGDDFTLSIALDVGARATLQAAGASLAQGRQGIGTCRLRTKVRLGDRALLRGRPGAVVVGQGSRVDVAVAIDLAAGASVDWRELVVLGRTGERPGAATLRWDVTRAGRPVLRQLIDLADPELARWGGMTAGRRVLAAALICDPTIAASTMVISATAVAARLDAHTALVTVLGDNAASVVRQFDQLCTRIQGPTMMTEPVS